MGASCPTTERQIYECISAAILGWNLSEIDLGESSKATSNVIVAACIACCFCYTFWVYELFNVVFLFFNLDPILEYPSPESICDVIHAPPRWGGYGGVAIPLLALSDSALGCCSVVSVDGVAKWLGKHISAVVFSLMYVQCVRFSGSVTTCTNISMLCRLKLLAASINEPQINAVVVRAVAMRRCAFKSIRWRDIRIFCKCQRSKVTGSQLGHVSCCVDPQGPFT